jgi:hypothetical protein
MRYDFEAEFRRLTNAEINRARIGPDQRRLLRAWLGVGRGGASSEDAAQIPIGLTADTLRAYPEIARRLIAAGNDPLGTQAERMKLIEGALDALAGAYSRHTLMNQFQRLRDSWIKAGIQLVEPASGKAVNEFEQRRRLKLPGDLREYLTIAGGMQAAETDGQMISFLSLPSIEEELEKHPVAPELVVFAEFCVWSHWYATRRDTSAVYAGDGENQLKIADSFSEFVAQYLADPRRIASCWAEASVPSSPQR